MARTKWCPRCNDHRSATDFYVNAARVDGLSGYCIQHHAEECAQRDRARRHAFLEAMGGECERCGFTDPRALQTDHVHGGGAAERRRLGRPNTPSFYARVLANRADYALLCANCNSIKKDEQNETVGQRAYERSGVGSARRLGL